MKKFGYVVGGVFLLLVLVAMPILSQPRYLQRGTRLQQAQAKLETVLDNLQLTSSEKELAMKIVRERAEAFTKLMVVQADLAALARKIKLGEKVSDAEAKKVLTKYYDEQKKYLDKMAETQKQLRSLPPRAQVVILAPGFLRG